MFNVFFLFFFFFFLKRVESEMKQCLLFLNGFSRDLFSMEEGRMGGVWTCSSKKAAHAHETGGKDYSEWGNLGGLIWFSRSFFLSSYRPCLELFEYSYSYF